MKYDCQHYSQFVMQSTKICPFYDSKTGICKKNLDQSGKNGYDLAKRNQRRYSADKEKILPVDTGRLSIQSDSSRASLEDSKKKKKSKYSKRPCGNFCDLEDTEKNYSSSAENVGNRTKQSNNKKAEHIPKTRTPVKSQEVGQPDPSILPENLKSKKKTKKQDVGQSDTSILSENIKPKKKVKNQEVGQSDTSNSSENGKAKKKIKNNEVRQSNTSVLSDTPKNKKKVKTTETRRRSDTSIVSESNKNAPLSNKDAGNCPFRERNLFDLSCNELNQIVPAPRCIRNTLPRKRPLEVRDEQCVSYPTVYRAIVIELDDYSTEQVIHLLRISECKRKSCVIQ